MILVSACLAGIPCRYDGKSKTVPEIRKLVQNGKAVTVCPELLGGLEIPRPPAEIRNGRILTEKGRDVTQNYVNGSKKALEICLMNHCDQAVLKEKSPACGAHVVYDGTFTGRITERHGIFASMLLENHIPCFNEYEYKEKKNESVR